MSPYVGKLAPLAVVLGVVGYCTVSGVMGSAAKEKPKPSGKALEFTTALLAPEFPPAPERDPFQLPKTDSPAAARSVAAKARSAKAKTAQRDGAKLVLNATCVTGDQRLAIINGQICREKDTISTAGAAGPPYVVTEILPHKVLLEHQGKPLSLQYSDSAPAQSKARAPAGASRGSSSATGKPRPAGTPKQTAK